jgi:hypothetical protein
VHLPLGGFGHTQKVESIARTPHQSGEAQSGATTSRCAFLRTGLAVGAGTVDACLGLDPLLQANLIMPERATSAASVCPSARSFARRWIRLGAIATVNAFTASRLFIGQSWAFYTTSVAH